MYLIGWPFSSNFHWKISLEFKGQIQILAGTVWSLFWLVPQLPLNPQLQFYS